MSPSPTTISSLPARPVMMGFLERTLPGTSPAIRRVREQVIEFVSSPVAKSVLLRGPIGVGKSTLARTIGLLKRIAPLSEAEARQIIETVRFDGPNQVDLRSIVTWYVELPLTGLVENLAEAQLFGTERGAFTGAISAPGVFERASAGAMPRGAEAAGAKLTGGVVFLDEIGELTPKLQAKLLPVLSGGVYYRLGTEGKANAELQFRGLTIAASWRHLSSGVLRPDLLSRVAGYTIDVPSIDDRAEDFDLLLRDVEEILIRAVRAEIDRMRVVESRVDRDYWARRRQALEPMDPSARQRLARVQWNRHGNLRGLTVAVEQILVGGRDPDQVIAHLPTLADEVLDGSAEDSDLLAGLFNRTATGDGLAAHVRAVELDIRRELRTRLLTNPASLIRLAMALGIDERRLKAQLRQLDRERRGEPAGDLS